MLIKEINRKNICRNQSTTITKCYGSHEGERDWPNVTSLFTAARPGEMNLPDDQAPPIRLLQACFERVVNRPDYSACILKCVSTPWLHNMLKHQLSVCVKAQSLITQQGDPPPNTYRPKKHQHVRFANKGELCSTSTASVPKHSGRGKIGSDTTKCWR